MGILKTIFGSEIDMKEKEQEPEFKQNKKYKICSEDNPNETKYRYCGKGDIIVPNCKLSLYLEEMTCEEVRDIELEIRNMLERHEFIMR